MMFDDDDLFVKRGELVTILSNPKGKHSITLSASVQASKNKYPLYVPNKSGLDLNQTQFEIYHHKYGKMKHVAPETIGLLLDDVPRVHVTAMLNSEPGYWFRARVLLDVDIVLVNPLVLERTQRP